MNPFTTEVTPDFLTDAQKLERTRRLLNSYADEDQASMTPLEREEHRAKVSELADEWYRLRGEARR